MESTLLWIDFLLEKREKCVALGQKSALKEAQRLEDELCFLASSREGVGMEWRSPSIPGGLPSYN